MKNASRPNILFLLTDDQRYNTIHALNNPEIITPNLDRLCKMGTAFTNAHIPGGTSGAVCMPSRAMLNTGRTLFHIKDCGQTIDENHSTMGQHFKESGYYCFGTGKWHNSPSAYTRSFSGGENAFFGGMWDHWNVPVNNYDPTGKYDNVIDFVCNFFYDNKVTKIHCDKFNPGVHSSELISQTVIDFINSYDRENPFFCYAAYLAPHDPRTMPKRFKDMYDPDKITLPENFMEKHPFDIELRDRDEFLADYPRDEKEVRRHLAEYYAMITHLDFEIGRIIDALESSGQLENTVIVMTGDNGLGVGCHGLMGKQNLYDHSIRIPLIMAGPGIPKNQVRDNFVYLLDIYPTLCELSGTEIPASVEGISFKQMFDDKDFVTREKLYLAYCEAIRGVKTKDYKLLEYRNIANQTQLFDLKNDPNELENLYGKPEYAQIVSEMRAELENLRLKWEDNAENQFTAKYWHAK